MEYHELQQRYGTRIATRVRDELNEYEFDSTDLDQLGFLLETRALFAQRKYHARLTDPASKTEISAKKAIDHLHNHWRGAEELSYLVMIAEQANASAFLRRTG